jgi:hypothetical protein
MNRKQFIILLVLVVVLGGAGFVIHQRNASSWQGTDAAIGGKLLPNLPVNDVAQITIQSGTNELILARRDNLWRVHERADYPADFSQISELLLKFADLKMVQSEAVGPSQLGRFDLLPPGPAAHTGTRIAFKDAAGKMISSILLGKQHLKKPAGNSPMGGMGDESWPDGRYVMVGTGAPTLAVISDPLDKVQPQLEQWLNKEFLSIENPRTVAVQFAEATNSWKLTRISETNDWQLADAKPDEKLDSTKTSSVTSPFSSASFNDVSAPAAAGLTNLTVLTVETFDGFTYVVKIAPKQDENYPVSFSITANLPTERPAAKDEKPADKTRLDKEFKDRLARLNEKLAREKPFTNWVYHLPAYTVDPLIKPRDQLLAEVKKEAAPKDGK